MADTPQDAKEAIFNMNEHDKRNAEAIMDKAQEFVEKAKKMVAERDQVSKIRIDALKRQSEHDKEAIERLRKAAV